MRNSYRRKVWVIELKHKEDKLWSVCETSILNKTIRSSLKNLRCKWPDYKFRITSYVPVGGGPR